MSDVLDCTSGNDESINYYVRLMNSAYVLSASFKKIFSTPSML